MNQSILIQFQSPERSMKVVGFSKDEGIVFDDHPDASPLNVAFGLQPLIPPKIPPRFLHDGMFKLDAAVESGGLRLSGFKGDPKAFPMGTYDINVEVESFRFRNASQRVLVHQDKESKITLVEEPDRRKVNLRGGIDAETQSVLSDGRSVVDGKPVSSWLADAVPRPARKACLLNILAKMRAPAARDLGMVAPLTKMLKFVYFADVDRIYAAADKTLSGQLERLVERKRWVREGRPRAKIHRRLLATLAQFGFNPQKAKEFPLTSYRQGGRNALQIVLAQPSKGDLLFADLDIDLGNPLWDLAGFFVHLGEVLDSGRTDHLKLHKNLDQGETKDFLYYDVV